MDGTRHGASAHQPDLGPSHAHRGQARSSNPTGAQGIEVPGGLPAKLSHVPALLDDLVAFVARDDLPAVAQAALAHAQSESIHPYIDGNGRVGRCLIHIVLRRRGVATHFVPPMSVVLAARPESYVAGLVACCQGDLSLWLDSFAGATRRAAVSAVELA